MALIPIQTPENAGGRVKEIFDTILKVAPRVPRPVQMMSASPELMEPYWALIRRFIEHPRLSQLLKTHIRLLVAIDSGFPYCTEYNSQILKTLGGLSDEEVAAVRADPERAALDEKEKTMLRFVLKVVKTPEDVTQADVDAVKAAGWSEPDLFEASFQGAYMVTMGILFNAFKMHED